jgi:hypothetical protein
MLACSGPDTLRLGMVMAAFGKISLVILFHFGLDLVLTVLIGYKAIIIAKLYLNIF